MINERQLVINKANEEAHNLLQENPSGTSNPAREIPLAEPNWEPNSGDLAFLKHYEMCILEGFKKGEP